MKQKQTSKQNQQRAAERSWGLLEAILIDGSLSGRACTYTHPGPARMIHEIRREAQQATVAARKASRGSSQAGQRPVEQNRPSLTPQMPRICQPQQNLREVFGRAASVVGSPTIRRWCFFLCGGTLRHVLAGRDK